MVAIHKFATNFTAILASVKPRFSTRSEGCDLGGVTIPLSPTQQAALGIPTAPLSAVALTFGVQNYTCSTDNKFESIGAVGEIVDISRLASTNSSFLYTIQESVYDLWINPTIGNVTIQNLIKILSIVLPLGEILGQHYFIPNEDGGISPVWNFGELLNPKGIENAVFVGKVLESTPDVNPSDNLPWLHVGRASGDIEYEIYRILTVGGLAPSSCVHGETGNISVKYATHQWIFGSTKLGCM